MMKNLLGIAFAGVIAAGVVYANQSAPNTVVVPVGKAPENDGKQMFLSFCAPCHGVDGRGNGPMAAALKQQPANLTLLSKHNGGQFPANHVASVLQFGTRNPSHGTAQMPVWGPMFSNMDSANMPQANATALRISNLSAYLRSLQEK